MYVSWLLAAALAAAPVEHPPIPTTVSVVSVYDGDTVTLSTGDKIRLKWANAPEMKPREAYAIEAKELTYTFTKGRTVELVVNEANARDGYGRILAGIRTDEGDLSVRLLELGLAHVYLVPPLDGDPTPYLEAEARARAERRGIWGTDRYQGTLHVTSFHANGQGDESRDPNLEYVRVCNITGASLDLEGYVVRNASGREFTLPKVVVPAGYTLKIHSGKGTHQTDPARQQTIYLGSDGPVWDNDHDRITILDRQGRVVDAREHAPSSTKP